MTKKEFDKEIKRNINNEKLFGYFTLPAECDRKEYKKFYYDTYYNKEEFKSFCEEMCDKYNSIFKAYAKGKGSELIGVPPKMASVASSSRFCYLGLRNASLKDFDESWDGNNWEFEKDLVVKSITGTNPQMDAYCKNGDTAYFFEFKCHEVFDTHANEISEQYNKFFSKWGLEWEGKEIPLTKFGLKSVGEFDLKQFITHLTGIIEHNECKKRVFSYVYFKPFEEEIFTSLEEKISKVFDADMVKAICEANNIELRLYFYENDVMDGFEKEKKPSRKLFAA